MTGHALWYLLHVDYSWNIDHNRPTGTPNYLFFLLFYCRHQPKNVSTFFLYGEHLHIILFLKIMDNLNTLEVLWLLNHVQIMLIFHQNCLWNYFTVTYRKDLLFFLECGMIGNYVASFNTINPTLATYLLLHEHHHMLKWMIIP